MRTPAIYSAVLGALNVLVGGGIVHAEEAGRHSLTSVEAAYTATPEDDTTTNAPGDGTALRDGVISDSTRYSRELAREIEQAFRGRGEPSTPVPARQTEAPAPKQVEATQTNSSVVGLENSDLFFTVDMGRGVEDLLVERSLFDPDRYEADYKSMVFRFGSGWGASDGDILSGLDFRSAPVYESSFAFEPGVVAVEYQYELLQDKWGLGRSKSCLFDTLSCQWRAMFHLDGGKVLDAQDDVGVASDADFLRAGLNLSFTFQPKISPLERFESQISTYYLEDLTGDGQTSSLSEKIIFWRVDNDGELKLRARYHHGDLPLDEGKLSVLTLGLEVKF